MAFDSESVWQTQRLSDGHSTLLVLLRLSPMAHQVWIRQIGRAEQGLTGLGEPAFAFQTGQVP